jgi:hypothetical protein
MELHLPYLEREKTPMDEKALEALHVAAAAIRKMRGVKSCTADNDNKSGEICFTLKTGQSFVLRLEEDAA